MVGASNHIQTGMTMNDTIVLIKVIVTDKSSEPSSSNVHTLLPPPPGQHPVMKRPSHKEGVADSKA